MYLMRVGTFNTVLLALESFMTHWYLNLEKAAPVSPREK